MAEKLTGETLTDLREYLVGHEHSREWTPDRSFRRLAVLRLLDEHADLQRQLAERDERVRELTAERDQARADAVTALREEPGHDSWVGLCLRIDAYRAAAERKTGGG
jgi:hypothetical protein